ncbi:MAG: isoprenylcysteine carboxylmethyltransferase family protein [Methanothrix sp.]|nr:isoprenylcysteine carboxylmethyltransferase family protein [Methanothrix sp.]
MLSSAIFMVVYFIFFAAVHSFLADPRSKSRGKKALDKAFDLWQRLVYNLLALLMVFPFLFILAFMPDKTIYIIPAPWSWLMACIQLLAAIALLVTLRQTGIFFFMGLSQLQDQDSRPNRGKQLVTGGFYGCIRNPLFFFAAIFLWSSPIMTENLLAFNILATVYFYIGARHEERSLKDEFGPVYEDYRKNVPMFLPRLRCSGHPMRK